MKVLACGFWGTTHWALDLIGRSMARVLPGKTSIREDEVYSMMGGAAVSGIFGSAFGLLLAYQSHDVNAIGAATLGFLLGVCTGVTFGAIVQVVDESINDLLNSCRR